MQARILPVKMVIIAKPKEKPMRFRVILEKSDEGGYTAYVPSLPGCISEEDTKEEALKNIHEAIELYLEPIESQRL
jgi:predicted RNase H-like HicB family nuclease